MDKVAPLVLPVPVPPERELTAWQVYRRMRRNIIASWPRPAYEQMLVRRRLLGVDTLIVNDPTIFRHVLSGNAANYERPTSFRRPVLRTLRNGLLLAEGKDWRRQRRMLAPLFTPAHFGRLLSHFVAAGACMAGGLSDRRVNFADRLQTASVDALCRALFSLPGEAAGASGLPGLMREFLGGVGRFTIWDLLARSDGDLNWFMRHRSKWAVRWFSAIDAVIEARRAQPPGGGDRDFLQLLMDVRDPEDGSALDPEEIQDQVSTLLAAGFETTARAMFWAVYLLSRDPAAQEEIRAELSAFPPEQARTLADLERWPTLRRAFLETLRLYPTAPFIARAARGPDRLGEFAIDRGAVVMVCPWIIHRHRRFWDEPDAFVPSRWIGREEHTGSCFLPFGLGPRICIGIAFSQAEAMIMLGMLLSRFEIILDDDRPVLPHVVFTTVPDVEPWFRVRPVTAAA